MAVVAGIVAQVMEDYLGHIGPFQGAIALTALALLLILRWDENYGEEHAGDHSKSSLYHQFIEGWKATASDSRIWRTGMTQALSEGAMYTVRHFAWNEYTVNFGILNPSCSLNTNTASLSSCGYQLCFH